MTDPQTPDPQTPDPQTPDPQTPDPQTPRHVEIRDESDHLVAEAEVTTAQGPEGTVRTSMHAQTGQVRPGQRASLVDAVMDLPEVQGSERMEAAVPYGDGESLERLRERTRDAQTRAAGSTTLLDANIPGSASGQPDGGQPDGRQPASGPPADGAATESQEPGEA